MFMIGIFVPITFVMFCVGIIKSFDAYDIYINFQDYTNELVVIKEKSFSSTSRSVGNFTYYFNVHGELKRILVPNRNLNGTFSEGDNISVWCRNSSDLCFENFSNLKYFSMPKSLNGKVLMSFLLPFIFHILILLIILKL